MLSALQYKYLYNCINMCKYLLSLLILVIYHQIIVIMLPRNTKHKLVKNMLSYSI